MNRGGLLFVAVGSLAGLLVGCFSGTANRLCDAGTEGCSCLNLQCEGGLECVSAICTPVASMDGSTSMAGVTTDDPTMSTSATTTTTTTTTSGTTDPGTTGSTSDSSASGGTSTGVVELCGNDELDADEECDGTPGCTGCELDNYDCNPLTNAPCTEGFKCAYVEEPLNYACLAFSNEPPGMHGAESCFYDFGPHDEWCDLGLGCAPGQATLTCDAGGCCVEYCDLLDGSFSCATPGDECLPALGPAAPSGLAGLGWCVTP